RAWCSPGFNASSFLVRRPLPQYRAVVCARDVREHVPAPEAAARVGLCGREPVAGPGAWLSRRNACRRDRWSGGGRGLLRPCARMRHEVLRVVDVVAEAG